jgi:hypothetical protein
MVDGGDDGVEVSAAAHARGGGVIASRVEVTLVDDVDGGEAVRRWVLVGRCELRDRRVLEAG